MCVVGVPCGLPVRLPVPDRVGVPCGVPPLWVLVPVCEAVEGDVPLPVGDAAADPDDEDVEVGGSLLVLLLLLQLVVGDSDELEESEGLLVDANPEGETVSVDPAALLAALPDTVLPGLVTPLSEADVLAVAGGEPVVEGPLLADDDADAEALETTLGDAVADPDGPAATLPVADEDALPVPVAAAVD